MSLSKNRSSLSEMPKKRESSTIYLSKSVPTDSIDNKIETTKATQQSAKNETKTFNINTKSQESQDCVPKR